MVVPIDKGLLPEINCGTMFSVNTKIITPYFRYRYERTAKALERAAEEQRALLKRLLELATDTEWGHKYGYGDMGGYEDFAQRVPLSSYEGIHRPYAPR